MASSVIHMCVAHEINKIIKKNNAEILIGSIAPDISKEIGETKEKSHFLDAGTNNSIPNLDRFLEKYQKNLDDDFVLGYYIHLFTDYLWVKVFLPDFIKSVTIYKIDGTEEKLTTEKLMKYIYNDYTNLNVSLLDEYNMDLSIFYKEVPPLNNIIEEIPMDKIDLIINKAGIIIENTKENKPYIFDLTHINKFIKLSVDIIIENLNELKHFL